MRAKHNKDGMALDPSQLKPGHETIAMRAHVTHFISGRCGWGLLLLLTWVSASGASCPQVLQQYTQPIPRALPPAATLTQIVDVVNDNSSRVQSLSTSRATVTTPGYPALDANIVFQRPRSFRLVGQKFLGKEVDVGSNDELLWCWIKRAQPPAMLFCRHDQFATSAARSIIPIEPEWLIEAMGVVTFDKTDQIEGPFAIGNGRVEVKTRSLLPGRTISRITVIDETRGMVLEEHLYDAQGTRLASAMMSKHVRDPISGVTLPRHVEIRSPGKFELTIDMADLQINQLSGNPAEVFAKPSYPGYNEVDLAQPNTPLAPSATGQLRAAPSVRY